MKTTTLEMFREELLRTGGYVSPPERMAAKPRKPGFFTTLGFTMPVFGVFPKCAVYEALGMLNTDRWARFCFCPIQKAEKYGIKVTLEGWNSRRDYKGPVVYLANHMSTLETIVLPPILLTYGRFNTVAKASLLHLPLLAKASAHMGLVAVGRTSPRQDLMTIFNVGCERIARGESFLIFPQGSREKVFSRKQWSSIGVKLAEKAGVPVVPIAVKMDCEPTRPNGKGWFKDFGTVDPSKDIRLSCGPVLTGISRELHKAAFDWIKQKLDTWGMPTEG